MELVQTSWAARAPRGHDSCWKTASGAELQERGTVTAQPRAGDRRRTKAAAEALAHA